MSVLFAPLASSLAADSHHSVGAARRCIAAAALLLLSVPALADTTARVIVKWKDQPASQRMQALRKFDTEVKNHTGANISHLHQIDEHVEVMQLSKELSGGDLGAALNDIRKQQNVEYAVADERRHALYVPNDPRFIATPSATGQWYLRSTAFDSSYISAVDAEHAWDIPNVKTSSANVIVAVVDTGVRFDHADLAGKLLSGRDFVGCDSTNCSAGGVTYYTANDGDGWDSNAEDPGDWVSSSDKSSHSSVFGNCGISDSSWHGTRVSGIIAAAADNNNGITGLGWNTKILPVRVLGKCGGYDSDIIAGMKWAAGLPVSNVPTNTQPANILNLSIGSSGTCTQAYSDAIAQIRAHNVSIVVSAGNDSSAVNAPANCSGVIAVTALRNTGTKVGFSSLGGAVTISAPGGNCVNASGACLFSIDTTVNTGTSTPVADAFGGSSYTNQTNYNLGTSFSAPIVSGTLALMYGLDPTMTPDRAKQYLQATATAFPATASATCHVPANSSDFQDECNCTTSTCGAGMLNAYHAVLAVSNALSSSSSSTSSSASSSNASGASSSSSTSSSAASSSTASSVSSASSSLFSNASSSSGSGGGGGALDLVMLLLLLIGFVPSRKFVVG